MCVPEMRKSCSERLGTHGAEKHHLKKEAVAFSRGKSHSCHRVPPSVAGQHIINQECHGQSGEALCLHVEKVAKITVAADTLQLLSSAALFPSLMGHQ